MASPATPPYPLGQNMGTSLPAFLVGHSASFADLDYTATGVKPTLSSMMIEAVLVKSVSATALVPGTIVKWSVPGTVIAAVTGASESPAGVVDPYLTASVAQNEYFWLIKRGPCNVLSSDAISANAAVRSAASGKAVTTDYTDVEASVGRQITEATAADQLRRTYVDCRDI